MRILRGFLSSLTNNNYVDDIKLPFCRLKMSRVLAISRGSDDMKNVLCPRALGPGRLFLLIFQFLTPLLFVSLET